jgi:hypothetical protein
VAGANLRRASAFRMLSKQDFFGGWNFLGAQKAVAAAKVARKAKKTKSDKELKLASEQAGSLRMED